MYNFIHIHKQINIYTYNYFHVYMTINKTQKIRCIRLLCCNGIIDNAAKPVDTYIISVPKI